MEPPYFFYTSNGKTRVFHKMSRYEGKEGIIPIETIGKAYGGEMLKTHLDKNIIVHSANHIDIIEDFRRGPQTIILKDAAYIIAKASVNKDSVILEAGTGSGSMTAYFALHSRKVYSFEIREEFMDIAKKNMARISNNPSFGDIEMISDDVQYANKYIKEKVGVIFLDMPEPWNYFSILKPLLDDNGILVCYVPNATQALECANSLNDYTLEESCEIMLRNWNFSGRIAKPQKDMLHTAFIVFARNKRAKSL